MKNVVITTGDIDGIGLEVTYKALQKIKIKKNIRFFCYFSDSSEKKYKKLITQKYKVFNSLLDAVSKSQKSICFIKNNSSPALQFQETVFLAQEKHIHGIVTAPLSKAEIQHAGLKDKGHTDILRRVLGLKQITMAFWGKYFSVVLATDHVPLEAVAKSISYESLSEKIHTTQNYINYLTHSKVKKIGVLGLNPHAGEIENLGLEEKNIIIPVVESFKKSKVTIEGPLVPDVCFHNPDYKKYSVFLAMYHDQGLIPFKIYHKKNHGVQISLNLPFVRTSVDHGTAKNIFGLNKADPTSMILAIQKALEMLDS